jgi:hypothetical protein
MPTRCTWFPEETSGASSDPVRLSEFTPESIQQKIQEDKLIPEKHEK